MNNMYEIAMRTWAAYLALHRFTNARITRLGMTADQFVLLCVLADDGAMTHLELSQRSFNNQNRLARFFIYQRGGKS
jgi:hypothetical protein